MTDEFLFHASEDSRTFPTASIGKIRLASPPTQWEKSDMTSGSELLQSQKANIRRLIDLRQSSAIRVATDADLKRTYISDFLSGGKKPLSIEKLTQFAKHHNINLVYFTTATELPLDPDMIRTFVEDAEEVPHSREGQSNDTGEVVPNASIGERLRFGRELVPIYGQASAGPDGRFLMNGQTAELVPRPPSLANVQDGYGAFVHGNSMEKRYFHGEIVYVAPHRPYAIGDFVLAQIRSKGTNVPSGFVKLLKNFTNRELILEQLNPPDGEDPLMRFPARDVLSVHKIVGSSTP